MTAGYLADLAIVFAVAVAVGLLFARWKLPTITGFLLAGVLIGPDVFGLVPDTHRIEALAEIGVVLLLFTVGLELSLDHLKRIWRSVIVGGALQVGLTTLAGWGAGAAAGWSSGTSVLFGFLVAMSSTAIVLKALGARGESDSPHGKLVVGVLIFQDLCVVPMMLALPLLAGRDDAGAASIALVLAKAVGVVAATLLVGRFVVPALLGRVAAARNREVLLLSVVLVSIATVWATASTGLSLALGAFLAGVVVAGTPFGRQAIADALPLRDIFVSLFFVSVGLLLDLDEVAARPLAVAGLAAAILAGKTLLAMLAALVMRLPLRIAVLSGSALAQVGEFSFVLLTAGAALGLVPPDLGRVFLAAAVLTMLLTPVVIALAPRLAAGVTRFGRAGELLDARPIEPPHGTDGDLRGHVVIAGFGTGGRLIADALRRVGVPHVVLDLNAESVRSARNDGINAWYADVTSSEVLERAGLPHASAFVLVLSDPAATRRAVEVARGLAPEVPVVARCRYAAEEEDLRARGAVRVVAAEVESSIEVLAAVLRLRGLPRNVLDEEVDAARAQAGPAERRMTVPPTGWRDLAELLQEFRVEAWLLRPGDWAVGRSLGDVGLRASAGASVVAVRRAGKLLPNPPPDHVFDHGDIVYVIGTRRQATLAGSVLAAGAKENAP
ncbi:MAG: cation:proton antiporter [Deltaproteobacteria bacterium]|nr:cation:proton antiporter [Deltaproteobacteria bacterium]